MKKKQLAQEVVKALRDPPKRVDAYNCSECGTWYEDRQDARDCCPPDPDSADGWKCAECDSVYETEDEAYDCCAGYEDQTK